MDSRKPDHAEYQYRAYRKCNLEALQRDLDRLPWHVLEIFDDIEDRWSLWKSLFNSTLDEHAPLQTFRKRRPQVPWITEEI